MDAPACCESQASTILSVYIMKLTFNIYYLVLLTIVNEPNGNHYPNPPIRPPVPRNCVTDRNQSSADPRTPFVSDPHSAAAPRSARGTSRNPHTGRACTLRVQLRRAVASSIVTIVHHVCSKK
jgi:hypothetical protein